jgi:undecaprenyl diphosphate synthase
MHRPPPPAALPRPTDPALPQHVGIIMDGNGRWAKSRHVPKVAGHRAGVRAIRRVLQALHDREVNILTLYAFSTENWKRSGTEVSALMRLFVETIDREIDELDSEGIQIRILGDVEALGNSLQKRIGLAEDRTRRNTSAIVNVALNYGGRAEVVDAVNDLIARGPGSEVTEEMLGGALYTQGLPDPDLIIRTAGEQRLSNFLIWQAAYAEIYVTDTLWPDMDKADVDSALDAYKVRERRYGGRP